MRDGGDFLEFSGDWVSIYGTSDPGTAGQTFYGSFAGKGTCGTFGVDAWLMFSKSKVICFFLKKIL